MKWVREMLVKRELQIQVERLQKVPLLSSYANEVKPLTSVNYFPGRW
jgi:hypothetical protein